MRTLDQINQAIREEWMADAAVQETYGFAEGTAFTDQFSRVSIESVLFYCVAVCIYAVERLIGTHQTDINNQIATILPHRPLWYRMKALAFLKDVLLSPDTDQYDTSNLTEEAIAKARVVTHCAVSESPDASLLTIKVAGGEATAPQPLDEDTETQLRAYLQEIKDAGVRILLVNREADRLRLRLDVLFDAQKTQASMQTAVETAIRTYIATLDFGGEYSHMALIDAVQAVEGVRIAELRSAEVSPSESTNYTLIDMRYRPEAGYMTLENLTLNLEAYK